MKITGPLGLKRYLTFRWRSDGHGTGS